LLLQVLRQQGGQQQGQQGGQQNQTGQQGGQSQQGDQQDIVNRINTCTIDRADKLTCFLDPQGQLGIQMIVQQVGGQSQQGGQQQSNQQGGQQQGGQQGGQQQGGMQQFASYPYFGCLLFPRNELNISSIQQARGQQLQQQPQQNQQNQQNGQQTPIDDPSFDYFCVKRRPFDAQQGQQQNPCDQNRESKECKDFEAKQQQEGKQAGGT
jgi:hypothetical protein